MAKIVLHKKMQQKLSAAAAISAGCIFFAFYPDLDNIGGSANPGVDRQGSGGAVGDTGTAFHAGIKIHDLSLGVVHFQHMVGTDLCAQAAADALFFVQQKGGNRVIISELFHENFSPRLKGRVEPEACGQDKADQLRRDIAFHFLFNP